MTYPGAAWLVRDLESEGQPLVGVFIKRDEDAVIYEDADGKVRQAPEDCVRLELFAEVSE